jgi:endonuclease VIII
MPEGPEVRRAADSIQDAIAGSPIRFVSIQHPSLNGVKNKLIGQKLTHVETYGKAFVLCFNNDVRIYVHLQLFGKWKTGPLSNPPNTTRVLRFTLETESHFIRLYSATSIQALMPAEIKNHPFIRKLGPDILNQGDDDKDKIMKQISEERFSRRRLGALLLDQSFFAGIGNYLRSEILFFAYLHPEKQLKDSTPSQREALADAIHKLVIRAYHTGGITTPDGHVEKSKLRGEKYESYRHYVFDREGQPCLRCRHQITKESVSGRRLYICNNCQQL